MEIVYSKNLAKKMQDEKSIAKNYGVLKSKILFCLSVLLASNNLENVPNVPPTRRHKLVGKDDVWALDLSANWRMLIRAVDGNEPSSITKIEIIGIEDYH